jgi:hypothetical protein
MLATLAVEKVVLLVARREAPVPPQGEEPRPAKVDPEPDAACLLAYATFVLEQQARYCQC